MPIRVELADSHVLMREALRRIVESEPGMTLVGLAGSGAEAVEMARLHRPDVAVVDIGLKSPKGLEAVGQILEQSPATAVLITGTETDERYFQWAVHAGACGYLLKDVVADELIPAIRLAAQKETAETALLESRRSRRR